jgi:2,5-dioxopentanoate dehydrogenase
MFKPIVVEFRSLICRFRSNCRFMILGNSFIGNQQKGDGSLQFKTFNPALNKDNVWSFIEATAQELSEATELASQAFKIYRNISDDKRAVFLEEIAFEIDSLGDYLIQVYCQESGLSRDRAIAEKDRTLFQITSLATFIRSDWRELTQEDAEPDRLPKPKPKLEKTYLPLGPVAVFGSSNFPLAYSTAGGDTASALAVGCPVIVKSHPMHAGTGELVASAIIKAAIKTGMPNGVFSNLNSAGIQLGIDLVKNPNIKAVGFTGSIKAGRAIFDIANSRTEPIPVFAEMGSVNPVVISPNSMENEADHWAAQYADSITQGNGQFCTCPGLILGLESNHLKKFSSLLAEKIMQVKPQLMLHPNIHSAYVRLGSEAKNSENVFELTPSINLDSNYAGQTILSVNGKQFLSNVNLHNEVFGPFSIIVSCADQKELLSVINSLEGQLTGTVIFDQTEKNEFEPIIEELKYKVGRLIFNGVPTGVESSPAMNHGGPYPASSDSRFTAVGVQSIRRWIRPICYQNHY